jgi:PAS domain S-box-containing protein
VIQLSGVGRPKAGALTLPSCGPFIEEDWSEFIQRISEIKSSHVVLESRHRCKDGRIFPVLLDMTLLYDAEGYPTNRVVYALDISERNSMKRN